MIIVYQKTKKDMKYEGDGHTNRNYCAWKGLKGFW